MVNGERKQKLPKYFINKENLAFKNSDLFKQLESFLPSFAEENDRIKEMNAKDIDIEAIDDEFCEQVIEMDLDLGVFDVNIQAPELSDIVFRERSVEDNLFDNSGVKYDDKEDLAIDKRLEALAAASNIPLILTSFETVSEKDESGTQSAKKRPFIEIL